MKKWSLLLALSTCLSAPGHVCGQVRDSVSVANTIDSLLQQVRPLAAKRQFAQAEELCIQAASVIEKTFGKDSGPYGNYAYIHAGLKLNQAAYEEGLPYALLAKNLLAKYNGRLNMSYARSVNNLAICYRNLDHYEKAEPLFLESLLIREQLLGKENADYAMALNNIGNFYYLTGDYLNAEKKHLEARAIRSKLLPEEHPDYLMSLHNLANVYSDLGNFSEAEKCYLQVKAIEEKHLETRQVDYSMTLNNLGNLYRRSENYPQVVPLLTTALQLRENLLGKNHPDYLQTLENLGIAYRNLKEYGKAETIFLETCSQNLKLFGDRRIVYSRSLHNLSHTYTCLDKLDDARRCGEQAWSIQLELFGQQHPKTKNILQLLADIYFKQRDWVAWQASLLQLRDIGHAEIQQARKFLSPLELENFIDYLENYSRSKSLFQIALYNTDPRVSGECYNELLFLKGLQLNSGDFSKVLTLQDSSYTLKYDSLRVIQRQIARQYSMSVLNRDGQKMERLEKAAYQLEKELVQRLAGLEGACQNYKYTDIQKALRKGEGAVEFAHFQHPEYPEIHYAALVLLPHDSIVHFLPLFEEEKLKALLSKTENNASAQTSLYAARSGELLDEEPAYGTELYQMIWAPVDSLLKTKAVKTIFYAPSGLLHRVAMAAIPVSKRNVLADRYSLYHLSSTRSLAHREPEMSADSLKAVLFGGIFYDETDQPNSVIAESKPVNDNWLWTNTRNARENPNIRFDYLPGTLSEIKEIDKILSKNKQSVRLYTGAEATEETLKQLGHNRSGGPGILHLATHGFVFPPPAISQENTLQEQNTLSQNKNPLLRSGLLLAGANAAWSGAPTPETKEDGIATAFEISKMDLSNTRLAVLSACQTGLGDLHGAEGVYGLQRAFKMAGVDYLLVSLWPVPDLESADFMHTFYTAWISRRNIQQAFEIARNKMRKKYHGTHLWGAWVLIK